MRLPAVPEQVISAGTPPLVTFSLPRAVIPPVILQPPRELLHRARLEPFKGGCPVAGGGVAGEDVAFVWPSAT